MTWLGIASVAVAAGVAVWWNQTRGGRPLPPYLAMDRSTAGAGEIGDFTLLDHTGAMHALYRYGGAKAVVIVGHGNSCPIVQKLATRMNELRREFGPKGVEFLMLNANTEDDRASVISEAAEYGLELPILLDPSQVVAKSLGLKRTGEVVVLDPKGWRILYRGAVSDRLDYGVDKQRARNEYLSDALSAHLAGRAPAVRETAVKGCLISYWQNREISYTRDIAPILAEKCLNCHSKGGRFPPFLESYDKIRGWSAMIRETLLTDRMPPFSADTFFGSYANDISLAPKQKHDLVAWIDAGMPRDPNEPDPLPQVRPPRRGRDQAKGELLYSVAMPTVAEIRPTGELEYHFYQLGGPAPRDMWVTQLHVRSTNPRQLHHESLMIAPKPLAHYEEIARAQRDEKKVQASTDGDIPIYTLLAMMDEEMGKDPNYVRVQVWGLGRRQPVRYPENTALFIPKGYYLILETHYMGSGRTEYERTTIDFYGAKSPRDLKPVKTLMVNTREIEIPPHAARHVTVTPEYPFAAEMEITGFLAHLHMRGRSVKAIMREPDGRERTIMSIPNFYYGWQTGTGLLPTEPIRVAKGASIRVVCEHDNSAFNPYNPDPTKTVHYGQTHDRAEMCKVNLQMRSR